MKRLYFLFALFLFSFTLSAQQTITGTIMHDGIERNYRLRVPDGQDAQPLVLNLHGFGSNALEQEVYSGMSLLADEEGFFACYPNGVDNAWNVGWAFGSTADDVGFISALIDSLAADYPIDLNRVYSCGMSNGGFMSYRLACELNDKIAAVASVTGSIAPGYLPDCEPGKAVPVLEIHGTNDETVPYNGNPALSISIPDLLEFWAMNNGCTSTPVEEELPNTNTSDSSTVTRIYYPDCTEGQEVLHFRINNGAHTWPGSPIPIGGVTNQDIVASDEIWAFFRQFTLDGAVGTETASPADWYVFPNPASDYLYFEGTAVPRQLRLYDLSGRVLLQQEEAEQPYLNIAEVPAGVYFLEASFDGGQRVVEKLIKKN